MSERETLLRHVCWRLAWKLNERPLIRLRPHWMGRAAHRYIDRRSADPRRVVR